MDKPASDTLKGRPLFTGMAGTFAIAHITIAVNVADTETVTIGDDIYEFDRAADGVVAGNIAVTTQADDTPAEATDALVAAINTQDNMVRALGLTDTDIVIISKSAKDHAVAIAETMGGAGNVVEAATYSGSESNLRKTALLLVTPTALEVTLGTITRAVDFVPVEAIVQVKTSAGVVLAHDGAITFDTTDNLVQLANGGAVDWEATSSVSILVFG